MKIFAERIHALRKDRNIRREDIAKEIGISFQSYRRYETDERDPSAPTIVAMADFFNVSTDYLLGRKDEPFEVNGNEH